MSDRTETLLAELVDLQRRQVANQERAIAHQTDAIAMSAESVARQKKALRNIWILITFLLVLIIGPMIVNWAMWFARR